MLLVPVRSSLSLAAYLTLWKAMIQVKAHTRRDGTQVKAHTRNIQSRAERRELVEALAKKMGGGAHTRHATLASAVGAARYASRANGKAVHVYEHADGGWVATHDETHTQGHAERIVAVKGKARLHRAGKASRSLAHLKGPIAEHVEKPAPAPAAPAPRGHRPARIKPEKPGYEGPEGNDMTDDNAAERKAARDLRAAVADKTGAVAKARIRLHDDVADIYAVKHPDGHITATVHWVEGQKARTQPHNSFNLEGFTSSFSGPRKWDTITAFKRDLDRKFGGKGYVHPNWRDAHYESELEVRDFSEDHARAVAIKEKRRKAEADAYRAGEAGRNQSQQPRPVNLAEELARQAAVATGDRADLKHPATRKAVVDDIKKLDVHTLAPRARWNSIDPDVTGKQLTARVQLKRAVPHQMTYINPNTGENQGRLVEHDGYDLQWHPDRGVSLKNDDGKKVWSDPTATKDPVAAVKAALQSANALPDMTYKA